MIVGAHRAAAASPGSNLTAVYARPGQIGSYWVETRGRNFGWITNNLSSFGGIPMRGYFEYTTGGGVWTRLPMFTGTGGAPSGATIRYVDTNSGDTNTSQSFHIGWGNSDGSTTTTGMTIIPDNPPTAVGTKTIDVWDAPAVGAKISPLTKTDTGLTTGGVYAIDSQSVANVFSISGSDLVRGSGTVPAAGQTVTVTLRYYDPFQLDSSDVPIPGQGIATPVTFTVRANPSNFGNDFHVNTFTANAQSNPSIATLSSGKFIIVWRSVGQGGETTANGGIYGQIFNADGTASGSEFAISPAGNNVNELTPVVSALNNDRFVVAYAQANADTDVMFRVVEANGTLGTQTAASSSTVGIQSAPAITTLTNGDFVIAWQGTNSNDAGDIFARRFTSSGSAVAGSEIVVNTTTSGAQTIAKIAALSDGNYVVTWRDPANGGDIYARVMGLSGAVSSQISVATGAATQTNPTIAALGGGGFIAVWQSAGQTEGNVTDTSSQSNIYGQRYNNSGAAQGSNILVNAGVMGNQVTAAVSSLSGGGFAVAWVGDTDPDGSNGLFGRRFNADGTLYDSYDFQLNQMRDNVQSTPALAPLSNNTVVASWADAALDGASNSGIGARILTGFSSNSNHAPTDISLSQNSVNQSAGANAAVGTLSATDADSGDSQTYSLVSGTGATDNASFNISGAILQANNAATLAAGIYSVRISTDDGHGGTFEKAFSITIVDDIAPVITSAGSAAGTNGVMFNYAITATGGAVAFGASGLPSGLTVNSGTGEISGTPTQAGTFSVEIRAADAAGNTDTNSLALTIAKAVAQVSFSNLNPSYDGAGKVVGVTTIPNGLAVSVTYNGLSAAPTNAGSYEVVALVNDADYIGAATNTLTIAQAVASVSLNNLNPTYDATGKSVTIITTPANLSVSVTYNGHAEAPTNADTYEVIATVANANYVGAATNTLTISEAPLSATADSITSWVNQPFPTFTGHFVGAVGSDNLSAAYGTAATPTSGAGTYDIVASINDPNGRLSNYDVALTNGTLTLVLGQPTITLSTNVTWYTLGLTPALLDTQAVFTAHSSGSFIGGTLTVSLTSSNEPGDLLAIHHEGMNVGEIGVGSNDISYGGTVIATYPGVSTNSTTLQLTFNSAADVASVQALLRNLTFSVEACSTTNLSRTLELAFNDGNGMTSAPVALTILINHAPHAGQDRAATAVNLPVRISFTRLLTNDYDIDNDLLTIQQVDTNTAFGGTITVSDAIYYTPPTNFAGVDRFYYVIYDGHSGMVTGTVSVYVLQVGTLAIEDVAQEPAATNHCATVAISGLPGQTYRILAADDVVGQWTQIGTALVDENGFARYYDTDAPNHVFRFYRTVFP